MADSTRGSLGMFQRLGRSGLRIALAVLAFFLLLWWFGMRMPGRNISTAATLTADEIALRGELATDVQTLAGEIGERNMRRYPQLNAAADFIEDSFSRAGLRTRRESYELNGRTCHNIEAEIPGARRQILVVGAHYDSVLGSPGANDNGSGVAALLALARRFAGKPVGQTLRFVAFANEEPPYFQTQQMGSFVYARGCKARAEKIFGMISLETIGY
ncbi:MAG TPA: M28 family peptidase, partial [Chthoniobacterales bacterium]|nr:M28 family peptidase [Chthoniobacterales bacterium]